MKIEAKIECVTNVEIPDKDKDVFETVLNETKYGWGGWDEVGLSLSLIDAQIKRTQRLVFKFKIIVEEIYTNKKEKISVDKSQWSQYGILD